MIWRTASSIASRSTGVRPVVQPTGHFRSRGRRPASCAEQDPRLRSGPRRRLRLLRSGDGRRLGPDLRHHRLGRAECEARRRGHAPTWERREKISATSSGPTVSLFEEDRHHSLHRLRVGLQDRQRLVVGSVDHAANLFVDECRDLVGVILLAAVVAPQENLGSTPGRTASDRACRSSRTPSPSAGRSGLPSRCRWQHPRSDRE